MGYDRSSEKHKLVTNYAGMTFTLVIVKPPKMQPFEGLLKKSNWIVVLGTSTFTCGITLIFLRHWIIETAMASLLVLSPNTPVGKFWLSHPISIPTDLFFFNWTNHQDFHNFSIKPNFEQLGPYRFQQSMDKVNVVWNGNNDTVTFNQMRWFYFDGENSNGSLTDTIVTLNAITMMASHYIRNWNYIIKKAASLLVATLAPHTHITKTVDQLVFEGYDDPFVEIAKYLPFIASEIPRFDRFGWLLIRNASTEFDGTFNMDTGVRGTFEVRTWNYFNETPYYTGSCAKVRGTGGELYARHRKRDRIHMFVPDLCRTITFDYEEDVWIKGILGYKYIVGDSILDNGTLIPENKCYCAGDCLPSGMINISSCRYGLPTYVSLPHFYYADPVYLESINGLRPNKSLHEGYIVIEPVTGLPIGASIGMQLNILVHPIDDIAVFQNVPKLFFPMLWVRQQIELPNNIAVILHLFLNGSHIIAGIGLIIMAVGAYIIFFVAYRTTLLKLYKKYYEKKKCQFEEDVPLQIREKIGYKLAMHEEEEDYT